MSADPPPLSPWKTGLLLAAFAALCAIAVALTWELTRERIEENRRVLRMQRFEPILAGLNYDTITLDDPWRLEPPHPLPGEAPALVYFAIDRGRPSAYVFEVSATGYAGPIRLLIGLTPGGQITAVRVLEHRETPGLGDRIEADRSDWIRNFAGLSLGQPPVDDWTLRRAGGHFEQFTGATITPRAVVRAVRSTLLYFRDHRDEVQRQATMQAEGS